jgi:CxxC-x17-CxxC domain-containing protein
MNDFKRDNRFGGDRGGGGGSRFGKRDFGGRGGGGFGGGPKELFDAVCANCGKTCQVPFRPNGKKPVFCNDCFKKMNPAGGGSQGGHTGGYEKKSFGAPRPFTPQAPSAHVHEDRRIDEIKRQLEIVNTKLDKLLSAKDTKEIGPQTSLSDEVKKVTKKTEKKSTPKKK